MVIRSRIQTRLDRHVAHLLLCRRCLRMQSTPVSGGAILSNVILIGQAPGPREPVLQRPFAHTAGKTMFRWFEQFCGLNEAAIRSTIYFAAVCRCFPGKTSAGGDRVPAPDEIRNCSSWTDEEIKILQPRLVIPVGRLAFAQFTAWISFRCRIPQAHLHGTRFHRERNCSKKRCAKSRATQPSAA